ncbi:DUF3558 family protein [Actinokineospora sp. G85]|uniref:DUF3558 family protein n=1 Tax=Actinokineospora sp. G85 TaxID=3406626 RepID=UPI003C75FD98
MRAARVRWSVAVLCLVTVVSGCGGPDLAKTTGQRTTVPAAEGLSDPGASTSDPGPDGDGGQFSDAALRRINPCELMTAEILAEFGTPARSRLRDFGLCSNYMKDPSGKELHFTLTIGETATSRNPEGDLKIGGLPVAQSELDDKTACFVTAITATDPNRGVSVQTGSDTAGGLCEPGRRLVELAVQKIAEDKPQHQVRKGTLIDIEPCTFLDDDVVAAAIGTGASKKPTSLHGCAFNTSGVSLRLEFSVATDPDKLATAAKTTPVDLGGVTAQQRAETTSSARCSLDWAHLPFEGAEGDAEVVSVDYTRYKAESGEDPCAKALDVAKAVVGLLPAK